VDGIAAKSDDNAIDMIENDIINQLENGEITKNHVSYDDSEIRKRLDRDPTEYRESRRNIRLGDRDIKTTIWESDDSIQVDLNGDNEPIDFDLTKLKAQIKNPNDLKINQIVIQNTPDQLVENLILDEEFIMLVNCSHSIIRNNTIKNVYENGSTMPVAFGIGLSDSNHSIIYNNTISNIKFNTTDNSGNAFGIFVGNAWNVTIESNVIQNINATTTGAFTAEASGIEIMAGGGLDYASQVTIVDNTISDVYASGDTERVRMISVRADEVDRLEILDNILTNTGTISIGNFIGISVENFGNSYNNKTLIHNNEIRTSSVNNYTTGIVLRADAVYNISITDNYQDTKSRFQSTGIFILTGGPTTLENAYIATNVIDSNSANCTTSYAETFGIRIYSENVNNVTIESNTINDNRAIATSPSHNAWARAFSLGGGGPYSNIILRDNTVMNNTASSPFSAYSFAFHFTSNTNYLEIDNNMITDISAHTTTGTARSYGFYFEGSTLSNMTVSSNTYTNSRAIATSGNAYSYSFSIDAWTSHSNFEILNNTFSDSSVQADTGNADLFSFILSGDNIADIKIQGNIFTDSSASANTAEVTSLEMQANFGLDNIEFSENTFSNSSISSDSMIFDLGNIILSSDDLITNVNIFNNTFSDSSVTTTSSSNLDVYTFYIYNDGPMINISISENVFIDSSMTTGGTSYSYGIYFDTSGSMENIEIFDNVFVDSSVIANDGAIKSIYFTGGNPVDHISFHGNQFTNSSISGDDVYGHSIEMYGNTASNVSIHSNVFSDSSVHSGSGTQCESYSFIIIPFNSLSKLSIINNHFTNSSASATAGACIGTSFYIDPNTGDDIEISGNVFSDSSVKAIGGDVEQFGFYISGSISDTSISRNTFSDGSATAIGQNYLTRAVGVWMHDMVSYENITIIDNNFNNLIAQSASYSSVYGIQGYNFTNSNIIRNIFGSISASAGNDDADAFGIYVSDCTNVSIEYNILEQITSSALNNNSYSYGYYINDGANITLDYNSLLDILATNQTYEIYLYTSFDITIGLEEGLGMNVTWLDFPPPNGPYNYYIFKDQIIESQGAWSNNQATLATENLPGGIYNYTIVVNSTSGDSFTETIWITITDTLPPELNSLQGNNYEQGDTNNEISWTFTDNSPATYDVLQNGSEIVTDQPWSSGIPIVLNVDGLSVGTHEFTIIISDTIGNIEVATILVEVTDTTPPEISVGTDDFTHEQGSTLVDILWNVTDFNPDIYTLYLNGTVGDPQSWLSGDPVTVDLSDLIPATYNFTVVFEDEYGNFVVDTVIVIVKDTTAPTVSSPADLSYQDGETGNILTWTVTDLNNGTFVVFKNETLISQATDWFTGDQIELNVDGLGVGTHTITIEFTDAYGNKATDTVVITVTTTTPIDTDEPDDGISDGLMAAVVVGALASLAGGGYIIFTRVRRIP
jgi:hypothetical protein